MKFVLGLLAILLVLVSVTTVDAYPVANAVTLDDLENESEVIFKGTLLRSEVVVDKSFRETPGFLPTESVFRVVSVLKGDIQAGAEVRFRHYRENPRAGYRFMPQHYTFDANRSYIVCAKKVDDAKHLRQIWDNHRGKADQGSLRCADDTANNAARLSDAYWFELQKLIKSKTADDVVYGIGQLDAMSRANHSSHASFDRAKTVKSISTLIESDNDDISYKAISIIGGENPGLGGNIWALVRLNPKHFPGYSQPVEKKANISAQTHSDALQQIANSDRNGKLRKIAIESLASTHSPDLIEHAERWVEAPDADVRSAAAILLADFAKDVPVTTWQRLLSDDSPQVRASATRAVAMGQVDSQIDRVAKLLSDPDEKVVAAAAASLLAFPIDKSRKTLISKIDHPQFACLFVNALATDDPSKYIDELGHTIRTDPTPTAWWGGRVTWGVSWDLLFKYAQAQEATEVRAGNFDKVLDSLESPVRDFESSNHYSSSEPRDLYAFYIQRNMNRRAQNYRKIVNQKTRYDMELYFKRVDKHPGHFMRN